MLISHLILAKYTYMYSDADNVFNLQTTLTKQLQATALGKPDCMLQLK